MLQRRNRCLCITLSGDGCVDRSIEEAVQCYKDAIGTCASSYQSRFTSAFSSVTDFAENFCGLDYTTWTMSAERCPLPSCDVDAALGCLNLDGLLTEDEALAGISR